MKSNFTYERLAQNEVSLSLDDEDRAVLDDLRRQNDEFLNRHPATAVSVPQRFSLWWIPAAAALLVLLIPLNPPTERPKSADQTLLVFHQTAEGNELLSAGTALAPGETVQLAYLAPHRHVAIVSIDGRGQITTHLPLAGTQSVVAPSERTELLPYAYRLDDAPSFESVILVTSDHSFALSALTAPLERWVRERGALVLPSDLQYTVFRISKKEAL